MAKTDNKSSILFLFDRLQEPIFMGKSDRLISFKLPTGYLPEKYQAAASSILSHHSANVSNSIEIKRIDLPDLSVPMQLGRYENFSLFIRKHSECAKELIDIFMGMKDYNDLLSVAVYARDRVNPLMFVYCLSVALLHREDTRHLPIPTLAETFPDKYFDSLTLYQAREMANVVPDGSRTVIAIPPTASESNEEHRVAYWREDIGVNLHHWHWHLVYPFTGNSTVVNKDRRGELFYYMHQQMIARYNIERLCNRLSLVKNLNLKEPVAEGYFSKLNTSIASRNIPSRPAEMTLRDIKRDEDGVDIRISSIEECRENISKAIRAGEVVNEEGQKILLDEKKGIDILGNILEASDLSVNKKLYGDVHNNGHIVISYVHDPNQRHLESFGVMGDTSTAMRDPIFYKWHSGINDIFIEHKNQLPQYKSHQLEFQGITVSSIDLVTPSDNSVDSRTLSTSWNETNVDLSRGLDFSPRGSVLAKVKHLNHLQFDYKINVVNQNNVASVGTCRIFMGPKFNEFGSPLTFDAQRNFMIEMDKFVVTLKPGQNEITRMSSESSVTIPFERTFRNLDEDSSVNETDQEKSAFCGCGWPEHLLIPRGTVEGYPMVLFVMISDYKNDVVVQAPTTDSPNGVSFCGLRNRKYPDAQSMGFPFDRKAPQNDSLQQFLTPNMSTIDITIKFTDEIVQAKTRSTKTTCHSCGQN